MQQITLRVPDDFALDLKRWAAERGESVNKTAIHGLKSMMDPEYEESDAAVLRAKLKRAGLLYEPSEEDKARIPPRPSREQFERARKAAGRGKPLSQYIIEERHS